MSELTLSEKTFLSEVIDRRFPEMREFSYEIATAFSKAQRAKFLALKGESKTEAREMLDNIISFQTSIKERI